MHTIMLDKLSIQRWSSMMDYTSPTPHLHTSTPLHCYSPSPSYQFSFSVPNSSPPYPGRRRGAGALDAQQKPAKNERTWLINQQQFCTSATVVTV